MKKTKILVLSAVLFVAAFAITAIVHFSNVAKAAPEPVLVSGCNITRQVENTPQTNNWVLYNRVGTVSETSGFFETGPGTPPIDGGSFYTNTTDGNKKIFLFNYDHLNKPLASIDDISYSTYRSAGTGSQLPALNLQVDFNGAAPGGFTTLVFEPVYNLTQQAVQNNTWQTWVADGSGRWWSTSAIGGQCAGATTACFRTWDQIVANNPDAVITGGVGINQGSGNGGLVAATDAFTFDETTYNFDKNSDCDSKADSADNCPLVSNSDQADFDGDGQGDACDTDDDNDGVLDDTDQCPNTPAGTQVNAAGCTDTDGDSVADSNDNCPTTPNSNQTNTDGDAFGDVCDADDDNDGVLDANDAFPLDPNESVDTDGDGTGNNADTDDDNDGQTDAHETACGSNPLSAASKSTDTDNDNVPNCVDTDDDNDGDLDGADNCPVTFNPNQADFDGDGIGDACDTPGTPPTNKDQCRDDGWMNWTPRFKNQGDCIQFVNTGK